jgi:hypothetical protein
VLRKLNIPSFPLGEIEAQLTMHNDNNFYKLHNDSGSPDTATRFLLTFTISIESQKVFQVANCRFMTAKSRTTFM